MMIKGTDDIMKLMKTLYYDTEGRGSNAKEKVEIDKKYNIVKM